MKPQIERYLVTDKCSICQQPVYADQGYHTVALVHSACLPTQSPTLLSPKEVIAQGDAAINGMFAAVRMKPKRRRAKAGTGKLALRVQQMVIDALQERTGQPVHSANLWLQEGAYRGIRWDLDSWGVDAKMGEGDTTLYCCSSLAPMSEYRSCKKVLLSSLEDEAYRYDISPAS